MKFSKILKKLTDSKLFWLLIAALASTFLWVYVTGQDTEEWKQTFQGVQVELVNTDALRNSKNMVITDLNVATVTLEVTGPRRVLATLSSDKLKAVVDVSRLSQAAYTSQGYTVKFPDGVDLSGLTVSRKTPDVVSFMVSEQTSKPVQVRGSFEGDIASNCTAEAPYFEPSVVTVSGPEANLKNISYAWVSFGENVTANKSYEVESGLKFLNSDGEECSMTGVTVSDETVMAILPILEVKEIPLTVDLIEGAGATSANTVVDIEPSTVRLAGDSAILAGLNKIVLKTINLNDFNDTFTDTFPITIDNQLTNLSGVTEAKVTVEIVGLSLKEFYCTNISCINATEGFVADIQTAGIPVLLRGPTEELEKVQNSNIRAVADLTDYNESTGTYLVNVKLYVDGFTSVGGCGDYSITVEIRKAE